MENKLNELLDLLEENYLNKFEYSQFDEYCVRADCIKDTVILLTKRPTNNDVIMCVSNLQNNTTNAISSIEFEKLSDFHKKVIDNITYRHLMINVNHVIDKIKESLGK